MIDNKRKGRQARSVILPVGHLGTLAGLRCWSLSDLARESGISYSAVCRGNNGGPIDRSTLRQLLETFEHSPIQNAIVALAL